MDWSRGKGKKGCFGGSEFFRIDAGRDIRTTIKSPQFRLILAKEEDLDHDRSRQIANYRSLFLKSRILEDFRRKWLDYVPEKLP